MSIQSSYKFTRDGAPNFDGTITGCWDDKFVVKIDDVDCRSMANKNSS